MMEKERKSSFHSTRPRKAHGITGAVRMGCRGMLGAAAKELANT